MAHNRKLCTVLLSLTTLLASAAITTSAAKTPAVRDPFWPVGYAPAGDETKPEPEPLPAEPATTPATEPATQAAPPPEPDWQAARKALTFSVFAESEGARSCLVNGRLVTEGDAFTLVCRGIRYTWRMIRIERDPSRNHFEELTARPALRGKH